MTEKELDSRLREIHISGIRYGKMLTESLQIVIAVMRGGYTPKKPLKVIVFIRNELFRRDAEERIERYKKLIKKNVPTMADKTLKSVVFEIKAPRKPTRKPLTMFAIDDYVDVFREDEPKR